MLALPNEPTDCRRPCKRRGEQGLGAAFGAAVASVWNRWIWLRARGRCGGEGESVPGGIGYKPMLRRQTKPPEAGGPDRNPDPQSKTPNPKSNFPRPSHQTPPYQQHGRVTGRNLQRSDRLGYPPPLDSFRASCDPRLAWRRRGGRGPEIVATRARAFLRQASSGTGPSPGGRNPFAAASLGRWQCIPARRPDV